VYLEEKRLMNQQREGLASGKATYLEKHFKLDSILQYFEIFDQSLWRKS
jgi:hypothetical protein